MEQAEPGYERTILGRKKVIIHKTRASCNSREALLISGYATQSNNNETKR